MSDLAIELAVEARRAGLVTALCRYSAMTLDQLACLIHKSEYADDLAGLTVAELRRVALPELPPPRMQAGETIEDAVMRIFRGRQSLWLASSLFVRNLGLRRWTAQKVLANLCERGLLKRRGVTSGTRYCLVLDSCVDPKREGCS